MKTLPSWPNRVPKTWCPDSFSLSLSLLSGIPFLFILHSLTLVCFCFNTNAHALSRLLWITAQALPHYHHPVLASFPWFSSPHSRKNMATVSSTTTTRETGLCLVFLGSGACPGLPEANLRFCKEWMKRRAISTNKGGRWGRAGWKIDSLCLWHLENCLNRAKSQLVDHTCYSFYYC